MEPRSCINCGETYQPRTGNQRVCGQHACRVWMRKEYPKSREARERKGLQEWRAARACVNCGATYHPQKCNQQVCSAFECKIALKRARGVKSSRKWRAIVRERWVRILRCCVVCNSAYMPKNATQKSCGADACRASLDRARNRRASEKSRAKMAAIRAQRPAPPSPFGGPRACVICQAFYQPRSRTQSTCGGEACVRAATCARVARSRARAKEPAARPTPTQAATAWANDGLPCLTCARSRPNPHTFSGVECPDGLVVRGKALTGTCSFWVAR